MSHRLPLEILWDLASASRFYRKELTVSPEFYSELRDFRAEANFDFWLHPHKVFNYEINDGGCASTPLKIVYDNSERVKLVNGEWEFVNDGTVLGDNTAGD